MFDIKTVEIDLGGKTLKLETGRVARQANGSVMATMGETVVLCAVTAAKTSPWHLRVVADDAEARDLESVLWLWAAVLARRTDKGWEVTDLVDQGLSYDEAGRRLGISQSAVSQRAQAAGLVEGRRARDVVAHLAARLLGKEAS